MIRFSQATWGLLPADNGATQKTVVAVAIAKLGEPAVVAAFSGGGSYVGTGRALSAAAGRLSYTYGLKVCSLKASTQDCNTEWVETSRWQLQCPQPLHVFDRWASGLHPRTQGAPFFSSSKFLGGSTSMNSMVTAGTIAQRQPDSPPPA